MRQNVVSASATGSAAAQHALRWQLLWHRGLQRLGWPGLLGLALVMLALIVGALAWQAQRNLTMLEQARLVPSNSKVDSTSRASSAAAQSSLAPAAPLPTRQDIHVLIAKIQHSAAQQQLVWLAADYRYKAATPESLARLEVHGSLRGGYKPLRLWLAQLKEDVPNMWLQEASFNRPNADVAEVDAKLVLVFALADVLVEMPVAPTPTSTLPARTPAATAVPTAAPTSGGVR